jgi:hypothetical protein
MKQGATMSEHTEEKENEAGRRCPAEQSWCILDHAMTGKHVQKWRR